MTILATKATMAHEANSNPAGAVRGNAGTGSEFSLCVCAVR
jgi:hypothetical protein